MDEQTPNTPDTPSWGKTIGFFFLCAALAITGATWTSGMVASGHGYSGYATGGIVSIVTGIVCAAVYRSNGKVAGPAVASLVVGVAVGYIAVQIALQMVV